MGGIQMSLGLPQAIIYHVAVLLRGLQWEVPFSLYLLILRVGLRDVRAKTVILITPCL